MTMSTLCLDIGQIGGHFGQNWQKNKNKIETRTEICLVGNTGCLADCSPLEGPGLQEKIHRDNVIDSALLNCIDWKAALYQIVRMDTYCSVNNESINLEEDRLSMDTKVFFTSVSQVAECMADRHFSFFPKKKCYNKFLRRRSMSERMEEVVVFFIFFFSFLFANRGLVAGFVIWLWNKVEISTLHFFFNFDAGTHAKSCPIWSLQFVLLSKQSFLNKLVVK